MFSDVASSATTDEIQIVSGSNNVAILAVQDSDDNNVSLQVIKLTSPATSSYHVLHCEVVEAEDVNPGLVSLYVNLVL